MTRPEYLAKLRADLAHAVTRYDRRQATRKGYNRYALALYLGRCDDVLGMVLDGATLGDALATHLQDRLRTSVDAYLTSQGHDLSPTL